MVCYVDVQLLSVRMPNAAGRGERISSDFIYGSKNAVGWSLNFIKPVLGYVYLPYVNDVFFLVVKCMKITHSCYAI